VLLARPPLPLAQPGHVASPSQPCCVDCAASFGCSPAWEQEVTRAGEGQILPGAGGAVGRRLCPRMQPSGSFEEMPGAFLQAAGLVWHCCRVWASRGERLAPGWALHSPWGLFGSCEDAAVLPGDLNSRSAPVGTEPGSWWQGLGDLLRAGGQGGKGSLYPGPPVSGAACLRRPMPAGALGVLECQPGLLPNTTYVLQRSQPRARGAGPSSC